MIRVVHIINIDVGVRIHMYNQMRFLTEQGYEVTAVCAPGPLVPHDEVTPDGITIKTIPITQQITPLQDLRTTIAYARYFRQRRFHIVHTHAIKPGLYGRIAARLAHTPAVVHTLHGFYFHDEMPLRQRRFWKNMERFGMMFGDYTLSQSREDVDTALREHVCKTGTIGHLGNGIQIERFDPAAITPERRAATRAALGVCPDQKVVAMSGRIVEEKGYREFFEAARLILQQHSDVKFWAMGANQPSRQGRISLSLLQELGLEKSVKFLGLRPDVPELLAAVDIFVLPSHGREGVPRVLMEASAMGKAIVATNVRGCREAIVNEQTGLLVPPRDASALACAVGRLLADNHLAQKLSASAREHALKHFDERVYFARIKSTYEMLLARCGIQAPCSSS